MLTAWAKLAAAAVRGVSHSSIDGPGFTAAPAGPAIVKLAKATVALIAVANAFVLAMGSVWSATWGADAPDTYRRLASIKHRYDPGNVFRRTHNIVPGPDGHRRTHRS